MGDDDNGPSSTPLLLRRPFLRINRTKIDVFDGTMTMEFDGEIIWFNIFKAIRYPSDVHAVFSINVIDTLVNEVLWLDQEDKLELVLHNSFDDISYKEVKLSPCEELYEVIAVLESLPSKNFKEDLAYIDLPIPSSKLLPSIVKPATIELKPLPSYLKYAFLGNKETLPVIISNKLTSLQEDKLLRVLREFKEALRWSSANIKGISLAIYMHKILLKDGAKLVRQVQRRLNPKTMEVVKDEVVKLLKAGIIYSISDSNWVSSIQIGPKKSGMTMVKNQDDELVAKGVQYS